MTHDLDDLDISRLRVLVVDDDKVTRRLISSILDGIGVADVQVIVSQPVVYEAV